MTAVEGSEASVVLTAAETRAAEDALIRSGRSVSELMEAAGAGAARWIRRIAADRPVTVLAGPGNNGGDGYVVARILRAEGVEVTVVAPVDPRTEAARQARALYEGPVRDGGRGGVLVDAFYGTGLSRHLDPSVESLLNDLAARHESVVAMDLPSGVEADTGRLLGPVPAADLTLALGAWKPAHWLMPPSAIMGERRLVPLGLRAESDVVLSALPHLPPPPADAHKYRRGMVVVVGGAMPGAALLASGAALRSGAGYVKLAARASTIAPADIVVTDDPLASMLEDGRIAALVVGPGLGRSAEAEDVLATCLASRHALVLDADALALATPETLRPRASPTILTPHEGELERLCASFGIDLGTKPQRARALAATTGAVVLAKGPDNILTDGERLRYFPPMPAWLSIAGTGDVLAGLVAGRLAATRDPFVGAEQAVWLHGLAARRCGAAFAPSDLVQALPDAYASLL